MDSFAKASIGGQSDAARSVKFAILIYITFVPPQPWQRHGRGICAQSFGSGVKRNHKVFRIKPSEPIKLIKITPGSDNITHNAQGLDRWVRSNAGNLAYRDD